MAKLTTIGMYQYDPTLFSDLTFPAGIDKDLAVCQILNRSGEFEVLYPNPDFFKQMITFWGKKHYRTFDKWIYALGIDFEPLYNYDRFEEFVDEKLGTSATSNDRTSNTARNESIDRARELEHSRNAAQSMGNSSSATTGTTGDRQSVNGETITNSGETENKVSAFDASTYSPKDFQETSSGQNTNGMQQENSRTDSTTSGESTTNTVESSAEGERESSGDQIASVEGSSISDRGGESRTEQTKHKAHLYGNIGVTTSAQMLQEFLDVERFNIYEQIADLFVDEFCIMVY